MSDFVTFSKLHPKSILQFFLGILEEMLDEILITKFYISQIYKIMSGIDDYIHRYITTSTDTISIIRNNI